MNRVEKPWGYYQDLFRREDLVLKEIIVNPGKRLSLQFHNQRKELWFIKSGTGTFTINGLSFSVSSEDALIIGVRCSHRIENTSSCNTLVIHETQVSVNGSCLEDDIVRIEDDYGRSV